MFNQTLTLIANWLFNHSSVYDTSDSHHLTNNDSYAENSIEWSYSIYANCTGCYADSYVSDLGNYITITGLSALGNLDWDLLFSINQNTSTSGFTGFYYAEDKVNNGDVKLYLQVLNASDCQLDSANPFLTTAKSEKTHFTIVNPFEVLKMMVRFFTHLNNIQ